MDVISNVLWLLWAVTAAFNVQFLRVGKRNKLKVKKFI